MFNSLLATVIFSTWYPATQVNICCCTQYLHRYSVFTPTLGMLHLIYDLWLRHSVFTLAHGIYTGTCHAIFDTWYPTPVLAMLHLSLDIRHRYLICHTWHLLLTPGIWYAFMWYEIPGPDIVTLDRTLPPRYLCIIWHIHDYHCYGDLAWLLYYYQILGTPKLLYSWTPVYLNP